MQCLFKKTNEVMKLALNKHSSLIELAETIADNKMILGDQLVDIGLSGPNLEATVASVSMAQSELGHARLLYRWAHELKGENSSGMDVKYQTGKAFQNVVDAHNWITLITAIYTVNLATDLVMKAIVDADDQTSNPPFTKMFREQNETIIYTQGWIESLLKDKGSIPSRTIKALEEASKETQKWLQSIETDSLLISKKQIAENANLVSNFQNEIRELTQGGVVSNV